MKKLINLLLCVLLSLVLCACNSTKDEEEQVNSQENVIEEVIEVKDKVVYKSNLNVDKQETVNVKTLADGTVYETCVEVDLKNPLDNEVIKDKSNLKDIVNTEGEETYTNDDNYLYWSNSGEDIHYKGYSDKDLPVSINIHYYLDGNEVSAENLAHATGHIKIRFDYVNNTNITSKVNGINYNVKIPFVCLTMLYISNDNFYNIEIDNGEIMDMDDSSMIIGFGFPGLQDSLKLNGSDFTKNVDIKDYFEIEADVSDFELDYTATIVSNGLLKDLKDDDLKDIDEMLNEVDDIDNQKNDIEDSKDELNDASSVFVSAVDNLANYLSTLNNYISTMNENSSEVFGALVEKMSQLNKVLDPSLDEEYCYSFNVETDASAYAEKKKTELDYYINIINTSEDENIKVAASSALKIANYYYASRELTVYTNFNANTIKSSIKDGFNDLIEVLDEFEDNIDELTKNVDSGLRETINRLKATSHVDKQYNNFSGIVDDKDGSVIFIIQSDEVK